MSKAPPGFTRSPESDAVWVRAGVRYLVETEVRRRTGIKRWTILKGTCPFPRKDFGEGSYPRYLIKEQDVEDYLAGLTTHRPNLEQLESQCQRLSDENRALRDEVSSLQETIDALSESKLLDAKAFESFRHAAARREDRLRRSDAALRT